MNEEIKRIKDKQKIELGKLVYETLLANNLDKNSLSDLTVRYNVKLATLLAAERAYRSRIVDPKPTKEQEKLYVSLKYEKTKRFSVVDSLLEAYDKDEEIDKYLAKYGVQKLQSIIDSYRVSSKDYLQNKGKIEVICLKIKLRHEQERLAKKPVQEMNAALNKTDKAMNVLKEYMNGKEVFIRLLLQRSRMSINFFHTNLQYLPQYQEFLRESPLREVEFINKISEIVNKIGKGFSILDFYILVNMDEALFRESLMYAFDCDLIPYAIYKKVDDFLKINLIDDEIISKEEALKISYSYNGINMDEKYVLVILDYLDKNDVPLNRTNVILAFEKMVKRSLDKHQKKDTIN